MKYYLTTVLLFFGLSGVAFAQIPGYSVSLSPSTIDMGQTITVNFTAPSDLHDRLDKIELFNTKTDRREDSERVGDELSGSVEFIIEDPGSYEARYVTRRTRETAAISGEVTVIVPDSSKYTLDVSPTTIEIGQTITVNWAAPEYAHNRSDKIRLYNIDNGRREESKLLGKDPSGTFEFELDTPGNYEVRYEIRAQDDPILVSSPISVVLPPNSDYTLSLSDTSIEIGQSVSISWDAPENAFNRSDKIKIINRDTNRREYSKSLGRDASGSVEIEFDKPGTYDVFYEQRITKSDIVQAGPITVSIPPESDYIVTVSPTTLEIGEPITISFDAPEHAHNRSDRIDIIDVAKKRRVETIRLGTESSDSFEVELDRQGDYEAWYYLNVTRDYLKKIADIDVSLPPNDAYSLSVERSRYSVDEPIVVSYSGPANAHHRLDAIKMYNTETGRRVETERLGSDNEGTVEFIIDDPGTYEFRYELYQTGFPVVQTSQEITVALVFLSDVTNYPNPTGSIVALGDSITFGRDADDGDDYVSRLEDRIGLPIINAGVSGDTTTDALARLQSDVISEDPRLVIVLLGGNDFLENEVESVIFNNIESIIDQIHASGSMVLLLGIDDFFITDYNAQFRAVADRTGAAFLPDVLDNIIGNPFLTTDLVHPTNTGHRIIADRIEDILEALLDI